MKLDAFSHIKGMYTIYISNYMYELFNKGNTQFPSTQNPTNYVVY